MADRNSLEATKVEAAIGNRILAEVGLAAGVRASLGHVSMRVPGDPNLFVVKGRGYRMDVLSRMRPEDMVVCDLEGNWVDGPPYSLQCSEVKIHSCIYKNRPDVVSVVHVHPDYVVLMSVLQNGLKPMAQEGARLVTKPLPVYPHTKIITSEEEGQEVAHLLGNGEACLLLGHGAVTASSLGGGRRGAGDGASGTPGAAELHGHVRGRPQPSVHPAAPGRGYSSGPARGGAPHQGPPGVRAGRSPPWRHLDLLPGGGHCGYVACGMGRSVEDEHVCQGCKDP